LNISDDDLNAAVDLIGKAAVAVQASQKETA
jgi:hypothetical protein